MPRIARTLIIILFVPCFAARMLAFALLFLSHAAHRCCVSHHFSGTLMFVVTYLSSQTPFSYNLAFLIRNSHTHLYFGACPRTCNPVFIPMFLHLRTVFPVLLTSPWNLMPFELAWPHLILMAILSIGCFLMFLAVADMSTFIVSSMVQICSFVLAPVF